MVPSHRMRLTVSSPQVWIEVCLRQVSECLWLLFGTCVLFEGHIGTLTDIPQWKPLCCIQTGNKMCNYSCLEITYKINYELITI